MSVKPIIDATGVFNGDLIRGPAGAKQSEGVVMEVRSPNRVAYPPARSVVIKNGSDPELMKIATNNNNLYLSDLEDVEVKFHQINNSQWVKSLGADNITSLLDGKFHSIIDVYNLFPRKPGSRAARHSLMFRPTNWEVMPKPKAPKLSLYIDLDRMELTTKSKTRPIATIEVQGKSMGVIAESQSKPELEQLLTNLADYINVDVAILESIRNELQWATPSIHKSLVQKIIRTRALYVTTLNDDESDSRYSGLAVLLVSLTMLLHHGGIFNPRLRSFITGIESASKRLAVTIAEDSHIEFIEDLTFLLTVPLLIRKNPDWFPSMNLIEEWWRLAWEAYHDKRMFDYQTTEARIRESFNLENGFYYLLKEIGSFSGDIGLMSHIAKNRGQVRKLPRYRILREIPIWHCLDHHNHTEIALYFEPSSMSFAERFHQIWEYSSKVNSRNGGVLDDTNVVSGESLDDRLIDSIRYAQELLWLVLSNQSRSVRQPIEDEYFQDKYVLSHNWLSGLVGPISIDNALVILHPDNPLELLVIKKPNRSAKTMEEFTSQEQDKFKREALRRLIKGIKLTQVPTTLSFLKGAVVRRDQEGYWINDRPWNQVRVRRIKYPLLPSIELDLESAITTAGRGVDKSVLDSPLPEISPQGIARLRVYLNWQDTIIMFPIDRDGSGSEYVVNNTDVEVFHFLAQLSVLYPAALRLKTSRSFVITDGPLFWSVTSQLFKSIPLTRSSKLRVIPDNLAPWPHQSESVNSMIKRVENGHRGNGVWIDPGMGKTRIFMMFLHRLIEMELCPRYVVYTLPPSAVESIKGEFDKFQIPHQLLDMRQTGSVRRLSPNRINLIWHDHLRLGDIADQLRQVADELLLVVDEFHLTMAATIRTSIVLELVSVSRYFVAMTGTIVKDNEVEHLIRWLSLLVDFEVNTKNYWVAVGALVSKKVKLKIQVNRFSEEVEVPTNSSYWKYVPESLGGSTDQLKLNLALTHLYRIITPVMVDKIKELIDDQDEVGVFVVARNSKHQEEIASQLSSYRVHLITKDSSVNLTPDSKSRIQVVITTPQHSAGYNVSKFGVMVTSVYLSNQATRDQLEHRIIRISQSRDQVQIYTYHAGVLTQIMDGYERARSWQDSLKSLADVIDLKSVR